MITSYILNLTPPEEIYPGTPQQRCWCHKTSHVLNALPTSVQPKAKHALRDIWQAETRAAAEHAFEVFLTTYELKYPKATACLQKDREELLTSYKFPAQHWPSLRTTNRIENPRLARFGIEQHGPRGASLVMACCT